MNVIFKTIQGSTTVFHLDENCPVEIAIIHYFIRCNFIRGILRMKLKKVRFILNNTIIRLEENAPIKEIFKNCPNIPILVNHSEGLIGGG